MIKEKFQIYIAKAPHSILFDTYEAAKEAGTLMMPEYAKYHYRYFTIEKQHYYYPDGD